MPDIQQTKLSLNLTIRNREKLLFNGPVKAVSSLNERGVFDILPEHTNFISVIKDFVEVHLPDGKSQKLTFTHGVLRVIGSNVLIYVGLLPQLSTLQIPHPAKAR